MLKLLKTIMRAGEPTVKYPFAPLEVCPGFRGKPELDPRQCIACAACTSACPANALTMETDDKNNTRTWQLYLGRCIYCGRCEEVCPTRAIRLSENFELAVTNKTDLYTRATFRLQKCTRCQRPFAAEKSIEMAVELLAQQQHTPDLLETLRQQACICPECRRHAALFHGGSENISFAIKEKL
ncbi:hydrogenase 4 subunit H [Klebsiella indica]|uniref:Hydrogenase 4 subunit H n=1 Tax=Klebsiella indica TaxID=2582917 RepID=A0A5R9LI94_9ENTR|nr:MULTISPECIES: hydrogenase 4 subunit H [Klebsiella]TLV17593.1 hydrogenase 4 subunit H [Klebsiella indica]